MRTGCIHHENRSWNHGLTRISADAWRLDSVRKLSPKASGNVLSREDFHDGRAVVNLEAFAARNFESTRIEAEQVQHGRMDVGHVVALTQRVIADKVTGSMLLTFGLRFGMS